MFFSVWGVFPWSMFLVLVPYCQRKCLIWFQFSWTCWGLFCVLSCGLPLKMFHVHLKRMCILLLWDEKLSPYISVKPISSRVLLSNTISFLIFCLEDLSIFDSRVLKSPTIIVLLLISFLKSSKIFMYLGTPMLGAYIYIYSVYFLLMDSSFENYEVTFWVSDYGPLFWSLFCLIWVLLPHLFFSCPFAWNISFQPFTFSQCRSFVLRWVSYRQHMCGSCFLTFQLFYVFWLEHLIHLRLMFYLIGTYSLSFFHTCLCLSLTLFLPFVKAVPLAFLAELVWWSCILLDFFSLGIPLFGLPF